MTEKRFNQQWRESKIQQGRNEDATGNMFAIGRWQKKDI